MIVYGKQIFNYIVTNHKNIIEEIILSKKVDSKSFHQLRLLNKPILNVDEKKAQAMARNGNHQGYFLKIKDIELNSIDELKSKEFIVVTVGVTDMGNIGSIVRSAYSLGADGVVLSGIENIKIPQIIRSSSGAMIDSYVSSHKDIDDLINRLKSFGYKIYSSTLNGKDINKIEKKEKIAFLFGSEAEGLPNRVIKKCDENYTISMSGKFDSLNVSNASAIIINKVLHG
jgi:23S rRNA (guanosine2251-2'-O)-methyltransferase